MQMAAHALPVLWGIDAGKKGRRCYELTARFAWNPLFFWVGRSRK